MTLTFQPLKTTDGVIRQGKAGHVVDEVMLHCAAIKTAQFQGMKPIQVWSIVNRWHHERGFKNGFGYHGLFMPDGFFMTGRPFGMIGAGCLPFEGRNMNHGVIHLLMIEKREIRRMGEFGDYFSEFQRTAVRSLIRSLPGIRRVSGHNDYAPKLCPGFKVKSDEWLN